MARTPEQLVSREVHYCVSFLVSTLAGGYGSIENTERLHSRGREAQAALSDLTEQAFELASPVVDYAEAIEQAGWRLATEDERAAGFMTWQHEDGEQSDEMAQTIANEHDIEPYEWDVFEHWIVSDWLADKLEAHGEKVARDFGGMTVWARTTSGQAIAGDSVIERIAADLNKEG